MGVAKTHRSYPGQVDLQSAEEKKEAKREAQVAEERGERLKALEENGQIMGKTG